MEIGQAVPVEMTQAPNTNRLTSPSKSKNSKKFFGLLLLGLLFFLSNCPYLFRLSISSQDYKHGMLAWNA